MSYSSDVADRGRGWRIAAGRREPECGECYRRRVESRALRDAPAVDKAVVVDAVRACSNSNAIGCVPCARFCYKGISR